MRSFSNMPHCLAAENGGCNNKTKYIFQYKIDNIVYLSPFCSKHATERLKYFHDYLHLKVRIFRFPDIEKEKVEFT